MPLQGVNTAIPKCSTTIPLYYQPQRGIASRKFKKALSHYQNSVVLMLSFLCRFGADA
jgi:hypothetical protein